MPESRPSVSPTERQANSQNRLRVNLCLEGEPAEWFYGWKARGLVGSVKDALLMSFQAFQERLTEQDLKRAQLRTMTDADE